MRITAPTKAVINDQIAVCKAGRHAHFNIFISMKKTSEGDPGRAAAAVMTFDHSKNIFVFDEDIDIHDQKQVEWALGTRFQADTDMIVLQGMMGMTMDPSLQGRRTLPRPCC